jgi:hypothetical protein
MLIKLLFSILMVTAKRSEKQGETAEVGAAWTGIERTWSV